MAELKWPLALLVWCFVSTAHSADDFESLDADFLTYLAEFEGEDDDWTIVEQVTTPATREPAVATPTAPPPKPAPPPSTTKPSSQITPDAGSPR